MDLILLQPGDPSFFNGLPHRPGSPLSEEVELRGEVTVPAGCIELVSMHHGMKGPRSTGKSEGIRPRRKPVLTEFTCVKYVDPVSLKLYEHCLQGKRLGRGGKQPTLIHHLRNSGDRLARVLTISLRDALVTEVQFQTHPDDMPTEQLKLSFTGIVWTYSSTQREGVEDHKVAAGWSVLRGRPIGAFTR